MIVCTSSYSPRFGLYICWCLHFKHTKIICCTFIKMHRRVLKTGQKILQFEFYISLRACGLLKFAQAPIVFPFGCSLFFSCVGVYSNTLNRMVKSCVLTFWYVYGHKSILCYKVFSTVLIIASWSHVVILSWIHLYSHKKLRLFKGTLQSSFSLLFWRKFLRTVILSLLENQNVPVRALNAYFSVEEQYFSQMSFSTCCFQWVTSGFPWSCAIEQNR